MKRKTNEDNLRAARARLRAARTLLKQAATLLRQSADRECMSDTTRGLVRMDADITVDLREDAHRLSDAITRRIAEAEAHLAAQVAARKRANS